MRYLGIPKIDFIQGFGLFIEILSRFIHNFGPGVAVVSWRQCFSGAKLAFLLASLLLSTGGTVLFNWCRHCSQQRAPVVSVVSLLSTAMAPGATVVATPMTTVVVTVVLSAVCTTALKLYYTGVTSGNHGG